MGISTEETNSPEVSSSTTESARQPAVDVTWREAFDAAIETAARETRNFESKLRVFFKSWR
jgi:hypothetical protein